MGKQSKARPSPRQSSRSSQAVEGQILEPELPRCRVTLVKTSWPTRYSPAPGSSSSWSSSPSPNAGSPPSSSATTSTTDRAEPSSAVQLRCWSRPTTTTRLPLDSDSAASCPAAWPARSPTRSSEPGQRLRRLPDYRSGCRGCKPPAYWPLSSPRGPVAQVGRAAARSSAMGRLGSLAAGSSRPPKAAPPSRRVRPPASIALDRGHGRTPASC